MASAVRISRGGLLEEDRPGRPREFEQAGRAIFGISGDARYHVERSERRGSSG